MLLVVFAAAAHHLSYIRLDGQPVEDQFKEVSPDWRSYSR
jgi:hypothetical protein